MPARKLPKQEKGLKIGDKAPDFTLPNQEGKKLKLPDIIANKHLVLYFYPRDNTPGCTLEAKDFTMLYPEFENLGVNVVGVSKDDIQSHQKFCETQALSGITLLSDEVHDTSSHYKVWKQKSMMGRKYMGIERTTFFIDSSGVVRHIWENISVRGHAKEVLEFARNFVKN